MAPDAVAESGRGLYRPRGAAATPVLYFMCADLDGAFRATYFDWYARRHAPDVLGVGFWSARAYDAVDALQNLWDVYEITGAEIFDTAEYQAMSRGDPGVAEAMAHLTNRTVTLYDQVKVLAPEAAADGDVRVALSGARVLSAVRFDIAAITDEEVVRRYDAEHLRLVLGAGGAASGRLCRRCERQHPWWQSTEPTWCGVIEWNSASAGLAAYGRDTAVRAHEDLFGASLSRLSYNLVSMQYGLVREDVWLQPAGATS